LSKSYGVKASSEIDAPAELVYRTLADYREGHPSILPKPYFLSLEVERGGFGEGTIINFQTRVLGNTQSFRSEITEPQPGSVLVETNIEGLAGKTTFTVEPLDGGSRSIVTIATDGKTQRGGALGAVERLITKMMMRRIYKAELDQIALVCGSLARNS
jgi:polyketide cyclase/dehydrase/lipid transport protein